MSPNTLKLCAELHRCVFHSSLQIATGVRSSRVASNCSPTKRSQAGSKASGRTELVLVPLQVPDGVWWLLVSLLNLVCLERKEKRNAGRSRRGLQSLGTKDETLRQCNSSNSSANRSQNNFILQNSLSCHSGLLSCPQTCRERSYLGAFCRGVLIYLECSCPGSSLDWLLLIIWVSVWMHIFVQSPSLNHLPRALSTMGDHLFYLLPSLFSAPPSPMPSRMQAAFAPCVIPRFYDSF